MGTETILELKTTTWRYNEKLFLKTPTFFFVFFFGVHIPCDISKTITLRSFNLHNIASLVRNDFRLGPVIWVTIFPNEPYKTCRRQRLKFWSDMNRPYRFRFLRDRLQISFLILSEFKWTKQFLFSLNLLENRRFCNDFRRNKS